MNPQRYTSKLLRSLVRGIAKQRIRIDNATKSLHGNADNAVALCCIDLVNIWSGFSRSLYLSAFLPASTPGGTPVEAGIGPCSTNDAIGFAMKQYGRKPPANGEWIRAYEPKWHRIDVLLNLSSRAGLTNNQSIVAGASIQSRVFNDLPVYRNFFAHRNAHTYEKATALSLNYGLSSDIHPAQVLLLRMKKRPQAIIIDWMDDLVDAATIMCE